MALNKILSFFQFNEDFDDDDDDIEETAPRRSSPRRTEDNNDTPMRSVSDRPVRAEKPERPQRPERVERPARPERVERPAQSRQFDFDDEDLRPSRNVRQERPASSKVVPIKSPRNGLEVTVTKPTSFDDSQDICDLLIHGKAVIANLEGFEAVDAQRIMDFISGCVYAMNGNLHQISKYIFIFSPENIDLSGDFLDTMSSQGFGVPTINREF